MIPTLEDPLIVPVYLSVALVSVLFQIQIDEGIILPYLTCLLTWVAYDLGFLIFRRYIVQHLQCLHFLASQPCPQHTSWGSGTSVAPDSVIVAPTLMLRISLRLLRLIHSEVSQGLTSAITGKEFPCRYFIFQFGFLPFSGVFSWQNRSRCSAVVSRCITLSSNG